MRSRGFSSLLILAIGTFFVSCSSSSSTGPNRVLPILSQGAKAPSGAKAAPKPVHIDKSYVGRHPLELSPGPPEGDTNDECTTVPSGWECVIQNGTNTDGAFYWPSFPTGVTVTWSAPPTTDGVTFTPATYTTTTPPYQYNYTETASSTAPVGNQYSASIGFTISGTLSFCQSYFCGSSSVPTYFQVSCALSLGHCPIADVTDTDLKKVVSSSPAPSSAPWVVGLQKNLSVAIRNPSGSGTYPTITSTTWTPPLNAVSSYAFGSNKTVAPSPLASVTGTTLQFYWTSGSNSTPNKFSVLQKVKRSDGGETADVGTSLSYLVSVPTNVSLGATYQPTQDGEYKTSGVKAVSSGTQLNLAGSPSSAGIETEFKATAPTAFTGYAGGGYFGASQVITASTNVTGLPVADACAIFSTQPSLLAGPVINPGPGKAVTWNAVDAPANFAGFPTPGNSITTGDSFVDYFIFRPVGKNAIWVSLGTLSWQWGAKVTNTDGVYTMSNVVNSSSATVSLSTTEPTWNSIPNPSDISCASLPSQ